MTTDQDSPRKPADLSGLREAAAIRKRYLLWLTRELRKVSPSTPKFNDWQLAIAAAEALEQLTEGF